MSYPKAGYHYNVWVGIENIGNFIKHETHQQFKIFNLPTLKTLSFSIIVKLSNVSRYLVVMYYNKTI